MNIRHTIARQLPLPPHIRVSDVDLDPAAIRAVMISEVVPADPTQDFYASPDADYAATTLALFRQAGVEASSPADLLDMGIYITNAVKTPKTAYAVDPAAFEESLPILEAELALFPNVAVIVLCGDVAKKMYNRIARKTLKRNVIPSGATYKIRAAAYYHGDIRVIPSYIITGGNLLIEKSKTAMIAQDIATMCDLIRQ